MAPNQSLNAYNDNTQNVIALLQVCHEECRRIFTEYAPQENGQNLSFLHLKYIQECVEICESTANYLLKEGLRADLLCKITAYICNQCAQACDTIDDPHVQACAQLCRETAQACTQESRRLQEVKAKYA